MKLNLKFGSELYYWYYETYKGYKYLHTFTYTLKDREYHLRIYDLECKGLNYFSPKSEWGTATFLCNKSKSHYDIDWKYNAKRGALSKANAHPNCHLKYLKDLKVPKEIQEKVKEMNKLIRKVK